MVVDGGEFQTPVSVQGGLLLLDVESCFHLSPVPCLLIVKHLNIGWGDGMPSILAGVLLQRSKGL